MAYVTDDKRVIGLALDVRNGIIDRETFVKAVKALDFLNWEVAESLTLLKSG